MQDVIYLDYAATTPVDPQVAQVLSDAVRDPCLLANPSALHPAAKRSAARVGVATGQLAAALNCDPSQLVWTSGATESDNLAILGGAEFRAHKGRHLVTLRTEHKAVTDAFRALEKRGFDVTWLDPDPDGRLSAEQLAAALRDETQLVSVMHVNNETGTTQDLESLGKLCRDNDILFHVDAAQSFGKLPLDLSTLPVDLLSVTSHKIYGPKGIGALYIADRPGCHVEPLLFGGGQQRAVRPGTLPVPLIVAFAAAAEIAMTRMEDDVLHAQTLRAQLLSGLKGVSGLHINGAEGWPGILNISTEGVEGESLLLALEPVCVATGSACNSRNQEPSAVLRALGLSDEMAQGAIRFSFGRFTTPEDIDAAADGYVSAVNRLRELAPVA